MAYAQDDHCSGWLSSSLVVVRALVAAALWERWETHGREDGPCVFHGFHSGLRSGLVDHIPDHPRGRFRGSANARNLTAEYSTACFGLHIDASR